MLKLVECGNSWNKIREKPVRAQYNGNQWDAEEQKLKIMLCGGEFFGEVGGFFYVVVVCFKVIPSGRCHEIWRGNKKDINYIVQS